MEDGATLDYRPLPNMEDHGTLDYRVETLDVRQDPDVLVVPPETSEEPKEPRINTGAQVRSRPGPARCRPRT